MATMTYFVALGFKRSEDGGEIVACDQEARSAEQAIRMAGSLAAKEGHCGAIAFSRTILKTVGEVDTVQFRASSLLVRSSCFLRSRASLM